jgi:hypothetical protein
MTENKEISGSQAIAYRNYRRARDRALVRLSHAYPNVYRQYLEEEKAFDEEQGTKWIGIAGRTTVTVGVRTGRTKSSRTSTKRSKTKRKKSRRR